MAEGDAELADLYREVLLDYFRDSSHKGRAEPADFSSAGVNPVCGDQIELTASSEGGKDSESRRLARIRYSGNGCVISQASSAIMAEALEGATLSEARGLIQAFKNMMLGSAEPSALPEPLEGAKSLDGVRRYPMRVKCATLAWNTLLQAIGSANGADAKKPEN